MSCSYIVPIFLLHFLVNIDPTSSTNRTFTWSCHLAGERRLECRNLFNFYFSAYSFCGEDYQIFLREKIDELIIVNDYHCFDHSFACYFQFDSTWSLCLQSLKKLTIENVSFLVRLDNSRRLLPVENLKIVNTHGSVTELMRLFQFSNRSSIYIENFYPRWSGMDLYSIYFLNPSVIFKQFSINVYDWYPISYMRYDQKLLLRQWLIQIPCLSIALGDCRSYHHDLIFLRDLFGLREEVANELYCYEDHGRLRFHWSKVPQLYYNYRIPRRPTTNLRQMTELHEECFSQFTKTHYAINSFADFQDLYSHFRQVDSQSIPTWTAKSYATLAPYPVSSTTISNKQRPPSYPPRLDYLNIYEHAHAFNETRWLAAIEAYPDGRFFLIDNRNQEFLLLNENGSFRIDLTSMFYQQIQRCTLQPNFSSSNIFPTYSFSQVHIDEDSYVYLIPTLFHAIYIFSPENRLVRCLTPKNLGIQIIRSDCIAITHTGLIYICDDAYRVIRIYTRMGVPQRTIRLDYLPLKLFISNTRMFSYSIESSGKVQVYSLAGTPIHSLTMCSYNLPSEVIWFRGKYFLTCGTSLYIIDDQGEILAEQNLHTLLDRDESSNIIHDFALNKNGQLLLTFRRNGTLFNRYWIVRPASV